MKNINIKTRNVTIFIVTLFLFLALFFISIAIDNQKGIHTLKELTMDSAGLFTASNQAGSGIIIVDHSNVATITNQATYVTQINNVKIYWEDYYSRFCVYDKVATPGYNWQCAK